MAEDPLTAGVGHRAEGGGSGVVGAVTAALACAGLAGVTAAVLLLAMVREAMYTVCKQ